MMVVIPMVQDENGRFVCFFLAAAQHACGQARSPHCGLVHLDRIITFVGVAYALPPIDQPFRYFFSQLIGAVDPFLLRGKDKRLKDVPLPYLVL